MSTPNDLTWSHRPMRELVRLAIPVAVSMLSYTAMTVTDSIFIGHIGKAALAGTALAGTLAFGCLCFGLGLTRSVKIVVSQAVGAGRRHEMPPYVGAAIVLGVCAGIGSLLVARGIALFLPSIAATAAEAHYASDYLLVRSLGAPIVLVVSVLRESRYGVSEGRVPMISAVAANGVNIALCSLFVGAGGGGPGIAAWCTIAAHTVELAVLLLAPALPGLRPARPTWQHLRSLLATGIPLGLQFVLEVGAFALLAAMIASMSETQMAAHQIAIQAIHVSFLPAFAIGEATSVLVGQAVGAKRIDLVHPVARRALWLAWAYMGTCAVVFVCAGRSVAQVFSHEDMVITTAVQLLWIAAAFQLSDGANMIARGALRGTGDVKVPAWICIVTSWACTPPLTWALGYGLHWQAAGGWVAMLAEVTLGAVLLWSRMLGGRWRAAAALAPRARSEPPEQAAQAIAA